MASAYTGLMMISRIADKIISDETGCDIRQATVNGSVSSFPHVVDDYLNFAVNSGSIYTYVLSYTSSKVMFLSILYLFINFLYSWFSANFK